MNPKHLAPPVVALALAGIIFGAKRNEVSGMRNGNDELRERIATARLADSSQEAAQPARPGATREPIAWNQLATMFRGGGDDNSIGVLSSKRQLLTLDTAGLLAELDRLAGIDLDDKTRKKLEMMIFESLAIKDPEAALERFKGALKDSRSPEVGILTHAFGDWVKRDLAAAIVWLDRETEAGIFESTALFQSDLVRRGFESTVIVSLMITDPEQAGERLSKLTAKLAPQILGMVDQFRKLTPEDEITLAGIARKHLVEGERRQVIGNRAGNVIKNGGDYAAVDAYLNTINAAPDERESGKAHAANHHARSLAETGSLTAQAVEEMRDWMAPDAAGSVEQATGVALGLAVGGAGSMNIGEASALVLGYHARSGDDRALVRYLFNLPIDYRHHPETKKVVEQITDPKREEMLRGF